MNRRGHRGRRTRGPAPVGRQPADRPPWGCRRAPPFRHGSRRNRRCRTPRRAAAVAAGRRWRAPARRTAARRHRSAPPPDGRDTRSSRRSRRAGHSRACRSRSDGDSAPPDPPADAGSRRNSSTAHCPRSGSRPRPGRFVRPADTAAGGHHAPRSPRPARRAAPVRHRPGPEPRRPVRHGSRRVAAAGLPGWCGRRRRAAVARAVPRTSDPGRYRSGSGWRAARAARTRDRTRPVPCPRPAPHRTRPATAVRTGCAATPRATAGASRRRSPCRWRW